MAFQTEAQTKAQVIEKIIAKPNMHYFHLLDNYTKQILKDVDPNKYINTFHINLYTNTTDEDKRKILRIDFIMLFGFSEGGFESISDQEEAVVDLHFVQLITSRKNIYGMHTMLFGDDMISVYGSFNFFNLHSYADINKTLVKKTDTYVVVSRYLQHSYYSKNKNVISRRLVKSNAYHAFLFFSNQRMKITRGNKNVYQSAHLSHVYLDNIKEEFSKYLNYSIAEQPSAHMLKMFINNSLWRDLNVKYFTEFYQWDWLGIKKESFYTRLKKAQERDGTRKLRETYFGTNVKSVQRTLSNSRFKGCVHYLKKYHLDFYNSLSIDNLNNFINLFRQSNYIDYTINVIDASVYFYGFGYSFDKLETIIKGRSYLLVDAYKMLQAYPDKLTLDLCSVNKKDNLRIVHDKIQEAYNRIKDSAYFGRAISLTDREKKFEDKIDNYSFVPVSITDTLHELGTQLHICVRSYDERAISKRCTIVAVYKDSNLFGCIEVKDDMINQAKLLRNRSVIKDEEAYPVVLQWMDRNSLSSDSYDLKSAPELTNEYTFPF